MQKKLLTKFTTIYTSTHKNEILRYKSNKINTRYFSIQVQILNSEKIFIFFPTSMDLIRPAFTRRTEILVTGKTI